MSSYCVIDIETDENREHNRVGNYWYAEILAVCAKLEGSNKLAMICYKKESTLYCPIKAHINNVFRTIKPKVLVAHNAKFELSHFWKYEGFQDWLKRGGKIWCTSYAHYILSGQTHRFPALRDIAVKEYGCKPRAKNIENMLFDRKTYYKELEEQGIEERPYEHIKTMRDIPREALIADVEADVLDTEQVYLQQVKRAEELGMLKFIEQQMESLLFTTECEMNGLYIDKEEFSKNKRELERQLEQKETEFNGLVRKYWR